MKHFPMKKYLSVLAILFLLPGANTCSAQVADSTKIVTSITKCWRAFSHEYAAIYGLEEEEIKRYSKQKVCIARDSIRLYYGPSYTPKYAVKKVHAENYAKENFDCSRRTLGIIVDSMYEVIISSVAKPGKNGIAHKMTNVMAFDGQCLYMVLDGVVFKLLDADKKVEARSAN
jgi:hypothetical protein